MSRADREERYVLVLNKEKVADIEMIEYLENCRVQGVPYAQTLRKGVKNMMDGGLNVTKTEEFNTPKKQNSVIQTSSKVAESIPEKDDPKKLLSAFRGFSSKDIVEDN